jgi:hypothetical protein
VRVEWLGSRCWLRAVRAIQAMDSCPRGQVPTATVATAARDDGGGRSFLCRFCVGQIAGHRLRVSLNRNHAACVARYHVRHAITTATEEPTASDGRAKASGCWVGARLKGLQGPQRSAESVANPFAINPSAPRLHSLGRTIAAPALNTCARCDFVRMVRLCSMNRPGVFVVGRRSIGADAAGSVSGRSALDGICLLCSQEQKQSDDDA